MMAITPDEALKAQVLVLHSAIASIAAASENRPAILSYFDILAERLMADLLAAGAASDSLVQSAQAHIQDFRRILRAPETTQKPPQK